MGRAGLIFAITAICLWCEAALAQPENFDGVIAGPKAINLHTPQRGGPQLAPLPKKSKLVPLNDLELTGPQPSHPFVLGNFAADGTWGLAGGAVQVIDGKNAAIQLAWANDFELTGIVEQTGLGGSFWLLGWDEGRGYALHNVVMKDSGSPWFLSEFRGNIAIEDHTVEIGKFEWKGDQAFVMTMQNGLLSLNVGRHRVLTEHPVEHYQPGRLAVGVYDTRYGPRGLRIKSLRIRALEAKAVEE